MESVFEFGLEVTGWLQATYPQLLDFFRIISDLGREEFYLVLLPLIYWCLNKRLGKHLAYVFLISTASNSLLKHAFRGPRPYWIDSSVGNSEEISYGVPSGHAQSATTLYLFLAGWLKNRWIWILAILMVFFMGLSRIYLGVHFVHDVIAGLLLGLLTLLGYVLWQRRFATSFRKRILGQKLLAAVAVAFFFALVYTALLFLIGEPDMSVEWTAFVSAAELEGKEGMATAVGALLGMGIGIALEGSRVRFLTVGPIWQRVARYLVGIVITVAIWAGLRMLFPADPLLLAIPLRTLRYFLVLLWVAYLGPAVFVRLRLASAEPEPGIDLKL